MTNEAVRTETISERLATLAVAIGALEAAIDATDKALQATSAEELSAAIAAQNKAANQTLSLKKQLIVSLEGNVGGATDSTLQALLSTHPDATALLPQLEEIELRLRAGQLNLTQQAQVVNKMQAINRQLLGALTDTENHSYDSHGSHADASNGRVFAKA